jgi:pyrroloquinoline-quinone synthase
MPSEQLETFKNVFAVLSIGVPMREVDAIIQEKSMLAHPFYQAWNNGELSKHSLREYAKQYYQLEVTFPTFLSAIHARCDDRKTRVLLLENMVDEEMGKKNHADLWLEFCHALGLSKKEVQQAKSLPKTKQAIKMFRSLTSKNHFAAGIAAMYAYESQIPEVAKTKRHGLKKFYGIKSKKAVEFFTVHEKADIWHSKVEREIITKYAKKNAVKRSVISSARKARDALWTFLDGVYFAYC